MKLKKINRKPFLKQLKNFKENFESFTEPYLYPCRSSMTEFSSKKYLTDVIHFCEKALV